MSFFKLQMKRTFLNYRTWLMILLITFILPYTVNVLSTVEDDGYIYHIALMDEDSTDLSKSFYDSIKNAAGMTIVENIAYEDALLELNRGNLDIIYIIKDGFENKIKSGDYRDLIKWTQSAETVSTSWMNDQLSVGVIRYWLKTDIVERIQSVNPSYTFEQFQEEFEVTYEANQLIDHQVIEVQGEALNTVVDKPLSEVYFFNIWGIFILVWVWLQNRIIIDDYQSNIISRMKLTEGSAYSYYFTRVMGHITMIGIPWILTYLYMTNDGFEFSGIRLISFIPYILSIFILSIIIIQWVRSKKSYTMIGYVFIIINVVLSSDLVSNLLASTNIIQKILPLYWFIH